VAAGADAYLRKGTSPQDIVSRARGLRSLHQAVPRSRAVALVPLCEDGSVDVPGQTEPPWSLPADLLQSAPFGLFTIRVGRRGDGDELWVSAANELACTALDLGGTTLPTRLAAISPTLDEMVRSGVDARSDHARRETIWPGEPFGTREDLTLRLHRDGDVVTAVLMPVASASEAGRLRRAIASVAHELRNPVTVLVGATQALSSARGRLGPDMEDRLFAAIDRQARHLERATTDLLTTVQRHSGTFDVHLEPVPLAPVLTRCVDSVTEPGQVQVDCGEDLWVCADRDRLEQIVANLVSNALKYGAAPVTVTVASTDDTATIQVTDEGAGVSDAFVATMFDEFTREAQRGVSGTGLGLHVVRTLVEGHHGTVRYSRTPDERTRFSVELRRVAAPRRRCDDEDRHE
jgi:signal transduction histidine kinase